MQKYLVPMAKNLVTGQKVKTQDLTGARLTLDQRFLAEDLANHLAEKMTSRTREPWQGFVTTYVATTRR
jgi:hypothetical protein